MQKKYFNFIVLVVVFFIIGYCFFAINNQKIVKYSSSANIGVAELLKNSDENLPGSSTVEYKVLQPEVDKKQNLDSSDEATLSSVKELLIKKNIYFGTYLNEEDVVPSKRPKDFLNKVSSYFNLVTIPLFWTHLSPDNDHDFKFEAADKVADFAVSHHIKMRGHCLVATDRGLPKWILEGHYSPDQLAQILKTHIQTIITHYKQKYPGSVIVWDVVNEAMADRVSPDISSPNGISKCIWSVIHKPGSNDPSDYIALAYQWAHESDPNALLYYNDYQIEYKCPKMDRVFNLINDMKQKGVPVNGVGFQSHVTFKYNHSPEELLLNMNRFAEIGVQSEVTEMDVSMTVDPQLSRNIMPVVAPTESDFGDQAKIYREFLNVCIRAKNCNAFVTWSIWDPESWMNTIYKDENGKKKGPFHPLLFDDSLRPKRAFWELADEVKRRIR